MTSKENEPAPRVKPVDLYRRPFYHCPSGCPTSGGKGQVPIGAPGEPGWSDCGSLDEEPEGFWEMTFERDFIVATRIHMLRRHRDFKPDPRNMPPRVNATIIKRGRRMINNNWRTDVFCEADAWTGSTTVMTPLWGNVGLKDLGITSLPGERERSPSPRDYNNPDNAGPARPRIGNTHVRAPQQREVRPRLRGLSWLKKPSSEEKIRRRRLRRRRSQKIQSKRRIRVDQHSLGSLTNTRFPRCSRTKTMINGIGPSRDGQSAHMENLGSASSTRSIAAVLESRRITVKLHTGTSLLGIRSVVEDSWTAHQERQRTS